MATVKIAPMSRCEGHLDIVCNTGLGFSGNMVVNNAQNEAVMFRGIENIMVGRDPRDAPIISQRV